MWYIYIMEYKSIRKRNERLIHTKAWMKHECIIQSQRSQFQKVTYCVIPFRVHFGKSNCSEELNTGNRGTRMDGYQRS